MNKIIADAARLIRVGAEYFKRVTIKAVKAVFGAKPNESFFVLQAADDRVVGKPVLYLVMPEIIRLPNRYNLHEQTQKKEPEEFCFSQVVGIRLQEVLWKPMVYEDENNPIRPIKIEILWRDSDTK